MGPSALLERSGGSLDFRRQSPLDDFIVDFVCVRHRLIVEVDGGQHNFDAHASRDAKRDNHFISRGFRVLRFWNNELDRNLEGVLMAIGEAWRIPSPGCSVGHPLPRVLGVLFARDGS